MTGKTRGAVPPMLALAAILPFVTAASAGAPPQVARRLSEAQVSPPAASASSPELAELLRKAGQYVVEYAQAFQDLVAEEVYDQYKGLTRRRTVSDIVIVPVGPYYWCVLRDVFKVDGHAVRDREPRIERLLMRPDASAVERALAIRDESRRYNIGPFRSVNEPTLSLVFLHPDNQHRFRFRRRGARKVSGVKGVEVVFEETARPTVVRDRNGSDNPARGRFWIDPQRGTVLASAISFEMVIAFPVFGAHGEPVRTTSAVEQRTPLYSHSAGSAGKGGRPPDELLAREASITVKYRPDPRLSIWVPATMEEAYPGLTARARYANYRRFKVETREYLQIQSQ